MQDLIDYYVYGKELAHPLTDFEKNEAAELLAAHPEFAAKLDKFLKPTENGFGRIDSIFDGYFIDSDYTDIRARGSQIIDLLGGDRSKLTGDFLQQLKTYYDH